MQPILVHRFVLFLAFAALGNAQSTVGGAPATVNASDIPYLPAETEALQRRDFSQTSFSFGFDSFDTMTPGGNLSGLVRLINSLAAVLQHPVDMSCPSVHPLLTHLVMLLQFVNNDQALATLPNGGVGQNLVSLAPCAVNQPHVHPRGTEISHVTQGKDVTCMLQVCCE